MVDLILVTPESAREVVGDVAADVAREVARDVSVVPDRAGAETVAAEQPVSRMPAAPAAIADLRRCTLAT